jgi:uncharacterized repeat protein (TIGR03943 family)
VFGLYEAWAQAREERRDLELSRRSVGPVVGWLLVLPLLVLILVAPTGLGAAAADRVEAYTPTEGSDRYPDLDASDGPVPMRVFDFLDRAVWDEDRSLDGVPVQLEGLVVNDPDLEGGFKLTRFMVSCCAADGIPLQVTVFIDGPEIPNDTWVVADVMWRPPTIPYAEQELAIVEADAISIRPGEAPSDPYESPY